MNIPHLSSHWQVSKNSRPQTDTTMPSQPTLSKYWNRRETNADSPAARRKKIADETLEAIEHGSFKLDGITHDLAAATKRAESRAKYYAPDSFLSSWSKSPYVSLSVAAPETQITFSNISTLDGARYLTGTTQGSIGVLNFASAKKPGGGFLSGAQAQEESLARSSTLYPTLMTESSQRFYTDNRNLRQGFYSHAMIYSPGVLLFRDDHGGWVAPIEVDILTSPAVNAGVVRKNLSPHATSDAIEEKIENEMRERMGRILHLFERQGAKNLVLGSFGTGVFKNNIPTVAALWAELLTVPGARFKNVFPNIIFAILGNSFAEFQKVFDSRTAGTWEPMDES